MYNSNLKTYLIIEMNSERTSLFYKGYSLQYIMMLMDIPITSLTTYVNDEEIRKSAFEKIPDRHPLEEFWERFDFM